MEQIELDRISNVVLIHRKIKIPRFVNAKDYYYKIALLLKTQAIDTIGPSWGENCKTIDFTLIIIPNNGKIIYNEAKSKSYKNN